MHVKSVEAQSHLAWCDSLEWKVPAQVSSLSLDRDSKLRDPSPRRESTPKSRSRPYDFNVQGKNHATDTCVHISPVGGRHWPSGRKRNASHYFFNLTKASFRIGCDRITYSY
ncbi:hypothetical protein TNCV_329731 [Trichonephila clavipes]|nr:hypothetical protein TNCV_329731 [Trichonephila clavipes]